MPHGPVKEVLVICKVNAQIHTLFEDFFKQPLILCLQNLLFSLEIRYPVVKVFYLSFALLVAFLYLYRNTLFFCRGMIDIVC